MANSEQFCNDPGTALAAAITSTTATSLSVTTGTGYPSGGNFRIRIEDELMLVTAVSGTTWTVTRGIEGTTAAIHSNGAIANQVLTSGAITALRQNMSACGTFANLPANPSTGDRYKAADSYYDFVYTGSAWQAFCFGMPVTLPPSGLSTWRNQGSSTLTTTSGNYLLNLQTAGTNFNIRGIEKTIPTYTTSVTVIAAWLQSSAPNNNVWGGLYVSDGTKIILPVISVIGVNNQLESFNSATSISGTLSAIGSQFLGPMTWEKVVLTASTYNYFMSADGMNWINCYSSGSAGGGWLSTPSSWGVGLNCYNSNPIFNLLSFQEIVV